MGFLMLLARKIQLQNNLHDVQYQQTTVSNQLEDLTKYSSILSQDSIGIGDISTLPCSVFGDALYELQNIHNAASQIAGNEMNQAISSGMFGANASQQAQFIAHQKMYENARKQIQKQLQAKLNEKEKELQNKSTRLKALGEEYQAELQGMDQQISSGIKSQIGGGFGMQG
ncbi:MAG: OmpH family outer membrane protein [Cyanobacteria bacterium RUI128]|nr:OmpH family outer membrane protein [Cyanobacteria bacterium RUI128]